MPTLNGINDTYEELNGYFSEVRKIPRLTLKEEQELGKRIQNNPSDEEAKQELIRHNLGLPIYIARKYRGCGIPFSDLIQEGNLGLINATNTYNPNKKTRFYSYAYSAVQWSIFAALGEKSRLVRVTKGMRDMSRAIRRGEKQNKKLIKNRLKFLKLSSEDQLSSLGGYNEVSLNLTTPSHDSGQANTDVFLNTLDDPKALESFRGVDKAHDLEKLKYELLRILKRVDYKNRKAIMLRFGLGKLGPQNFENIAKSLGCEVRSTYGYYNYGILVLQRLKHRLKEHVS